MFYLLNPFLGQISRGQWWLAQLVIFVLSTLAMTAAFLSIADPSALPAVPELFGNPAVLLILVVCAYMNFCVCLNRLRDTGRSGLLYLAFCVPIIGVCLMIYFCGIETGTAKSETSRSHRLKTPQQFDQGALAVGPTFGRR